MNEWLPVPPHQVTVGVGGRGERRVGGRHRLVGRSSRDHLPNHHCQCYPGEIEIPPSHSHPLQRLPVISDDNGASTPWKERRPRDSRLTTEVIGDRLSSQRHCCCHWFSFLDHTL